ncbi:NAD(P)/FAD-dependent oxidoreductase [Microbacterium lacticum]|uniref:NADH:ubiquinone reductase (non-electrogenic) n=1 Tax=Microbacterium lacticum TaxID=33885 RepID=A0A4Y3UMZ2_9MICO|nr:NAD(P)/FAD-dependent oxidoreductase [Microbacterium lacticum]TQM90992.1 NADH dehydrogenase [Microbacterium lacticum]GEB95552.1 6-phosphogluconate dehydrogenase [Microbacterium lacticum]GGI71355.1 6-phosphogluconate dehydrogenase [Microbacterium lacticum]
MSHSEASAHLPHIVIIGGGFAGVSAARALRHAPVRVTLVDRRIYNTFQPLLYQVATGGLNPGDVTHFLRSLRAQQPNLDVVHEHLMEIDTDARAVRLLDGQELAYDYLLLANGVTTAYHGTPGAKENSFAVYSRSQAITIRDTLFTRLERAAVRPDRDKGLSVVVIGGGPTGVEMAGALAELRDQGLEPAYPELEGDAFRITLLQRSEILKPFLPKLRTYAAAQLRRRDVTVRLGAGVEEVCPDSVRLSDGTVLPSDLTIWATGVAPHEEVRHWSLPLDEGDRIRVGADLQVEGLPGVFAAGDVAITPQDLPQLAQPAIQGGAHVARQIQRLLAGEPTEPFEYYDKGQLAIIGRRSAVGEVPGVANLPVLHSIGILQRVPLLRRIVPLTGRPAWFVWLFVHISSLLGPRNKLQVMVGLVARYGARLHRAPVPIVGDVPAIRPSKAQRRRLSPAERSAVDAAAAEDAG